jgi:hypothetical protein
LLQVYLPRGIEEYNENLRQDIRSPGRELNPRPPKYKAGVILSTTTFNAARLKFYDL